MNDIQESHGNNNIDDMQEINGNGRNHTNQLFSPEAFNPNTKNELGDACLDLQKLPNHMASMMNYELDQNM